MMFKSNRPPPLLDVEDDDQRQNRIGDILERLNTSSSNPSKSPQIFPNMISLPIEPPAALLARVRDFLPAISTSNEALSRQRREDIDIEHIAHDEHQYIEMNLGLGVYETKRRPRPNVNTDMLSSEEDSASDRATDNDSSSGSDLESDYDSDGESDEYSSSDGDRDDDDTDSESGSAASIGIKHVSSRPIKPLPRRALSQQTQQQLQV